MNGKAVTVQAGNSALRFIYYKPNLVRVDYLPTLTTTSDSSVVVIQDTIQSVSYAVSESDSSLTFSSSGLQILCHKYPLRVSFYTAGGHLLVGEPMSGGLTSNLTQRIANFSIQSNEHFYGTGERGVSFDLRGLAFDSYNSQHFGYGFPAPATMNVNVPFIISTNNYGIYFENTYRGNFDVGHTNTNVLTYTAAGGELSYYLICGPTMADVLSDYTWLTGRAPLLPKWSFGYFQSKFGYRNGTDASNMIQQMRNDSIPCDAIVLDLYWFVNMGDLAWNTSSWPGPTQMTSNFLSKGFKTIVITEPYITQSSFNFSTADQSGYLAKNAFGQSYLINNWWSCGCNAGLVDITSPAAQTWWWSKYNDQAGNSIFSTGVSGVWTDLGEPETDYPDMHFSMGSDSMVHNIYNFLWARTLFDGFSKAFPNQRLFNLTRSGYAGIQRFNVVTWSGDVSKSFGGLAVQLPFLLNMGMSGIAYHNSDIGGFDAGSTTSELYSRWMEFGTFCPVMRAHGYDVDNGTEPWTFGTATENIVRKMIQLRYSLLPYNYTTAHDAYVSGIPLARPLVLAYPIDPNFHNESSAYMWGDNFIVAPVVTSGQTVQTVYLPEGKWINYWTDQIHSGGTTISVPAPIDEVPLFVKAGSIVPMQPVMDYVDQFPADTIELAIYPDPTISASYTLYEDDGKTLDYQHGAFATTLFREQTGSNGTSPTLQISIGPTIGTYNGKLAHRSYVCSIHNVSIRPSNVLLQASPLPLIASTGILQSVPSGYYYDGQSSILYIKFFANVDSSYSILADSLEVTGIKQSYKSPSGYELYQNFPNPFNPSTVISFDIPVESFVTLRVYNTLGQEVARLVNENRSTGHHTVELDARNLPSGIYFSRLSAGRFVGTKKMILLR